MRAERRRRELCVSVFERLSTEAKPAEGRPWPSDDDDEDDEDDDDTYSTRLSQTPDVFDRFIAIYSFRYSYCNDKNHDNPDDDHKDGGDYVDNDESVDNYCGNGDSIDNCGMTMMTIIMH